jgi:glycosyltransferase involved in cell wall biosynthesis
MKLTIITPVFNGDKFLEETIDSVLKNCSGLDFEYLVVNDGSTDRTPEILNKYSNQIKIINKVNSGQADAINEGIRTSKGEFGIIVNADDPLMSPDLFSKAFKILEDRKYIVCYPDWMMISESGDKIKNRKTKEYSQKKLIGDFNCLPGPGAVFRLDVAKSISGWNRNYRYVADYDFWLRLSMHGEFKRIPLTLAKWRFHNDSTSVSQKNMSMALERIKVIEDFPFENQISRALMRRASASSYFQAAVLSFFDSTIPGRKWFFQSISIQPSILLRKSPIRSTYLLLHPYSWKILNSFRTRRG